jgi:multidrug efflux pump subunit AcrA (membrane-fusion protein)
MENREYVELRSEDVQEILGTPPGWLVRWGTVLVLAGFILMVGVAWVVRYPDVIESKVVITTSNPPVDVIARADGKIDRLFVKDKMPVAENKILAVLHSTSNYQHVLLLDSLTAVWQRMSMDALRGVSAPIGLELGDLETVYAEFTSNLDAYKFGKSAKTTSSNTNIAAINQQIHQLEQGMEFDKKALRRVQDLIVTAEEMLKNQKKLFDDKIISKADFERERTKVVELEQQRDQYDQSIIQKQTSILTLKRSISDVSINRDENDANSGSRLHSSLNTLKGSLDRWQQTYLLTAPIGGKVSLNASFFSAQQFVRQGETVLTIVPPENGNIVGRLLLPVAKSGKVKSKPPQRVIIKLDSYPYNEWGTIQGEVISKSLVPKDDQYAIVVSVLNVQNTTLISSYGKQIPFEQHLQGIAEIITEDKGLLERIGDQMFARIR